MGHQLGMLRKRESKQEYKRQRLGNEKGERQRAGGGLWTVHGGATKLEPMGEFLKASAMKKLQTQL